MAENQTTHTPGPWAQFIDRHEGIVTIVPAGRAGEIAMVPVAGEGDANAFLIAAAPTLLEACELAVDLFESDEGIYRVLIRAIALAKGDHETLMDIADQEATELMARLQQKGIFT